MDQLRAMAVFVAVAEEAGMAPAARRLRMSAPSVTRAVAELETHLGCRLLHRTTRTVRLTAAGERYLGDCRRVLAEIEDADRAVAGVHALPKGMVAVTASVLFGRLVLMPILLDLLKSCPEIVISGLFVDRVVHLVDEGIDVAVRIAELPSSGLSATRVGSVRRVLCASPHYLKEHGHPGTPADLLDHDLIDFVNMAPAGEWNFRDNGRTTCIRPQSRLKLNNADAALSAAVAGHGITRILSYMIAADLAAGRLETVLDDHAPPPLPVHVVHKEGGLTSARVRAVVDFLVKHLRVHPTLAENNS